MNFKKFHLIPQWASDTGGFMAAVNNLIEVSMKKVNSEMCEVLCAVRLSGCFSLRRLCAPNPLITL